MKTARAISTEKLKTKIAGIPYNIIMQLAGGITGLLLAMTGIYGNYMPFGISAAAAAPSNVLYATAAGSIAGYLMLQPATVSLRYISAVILAVIIRRSLSSLKTLNSKQGYIPAVSFASCLLTGIVYGISNEMTALNALMYVTEAVISAGASYFMAYAMNAAVNRQNVYRMSRRELLCAAAAVCLMASPLSTFEIYGISPVRTVASYVVLTASSYAGISAGTMAGTLAGFAAGFSGGMSHLVGSYAFGGLLAGAFSRAGRFGSAAAFAIANGIIALMEGGTSETAATFVEAAIATVIFVAMPSCVSRRIEGVVEKYRDSSRDAAELRRTVSSRLKFASKALNEVSDSVEAVSKRLARICAHDMSEVYSKVRESACSKCGLKAYCWNTVKAETDTIFEKIGDAAREKQYLTEADIPEAFAKRCIKLDELLENMNRNYSEYLLRETAEARVAQVRAVVADQFDGIAQLLENLSDEFGGEETREPLLENRLAPVFSAFGIDPDELRCTTDRFKRMKIRVSTDELDSPVDEQSLTAAVSDVCGREFDAPVIATVCGETMVSFYQKAIFSPTTAHVQIPCGGSRFCGDSFEIFSDGKGREIIVISDGMGTGGRAAVDGAMASSLLSKLVSAGFGFDAALRVVNSALLVKSGDESLATLDIACIDLFSGRAEFLKAGAPPSFICRSGRAVKVEQSTLPAGILREVEFGRYSVELGPDDMIVLVSDGAVENGSDWIQEMLEEWHGSDLNVLAENIANGAKERSAGGHDDDITVIVTRLGAVSGVPKLSAVAAMF